MMKWRNTMIISWIQYHRRGALRRIGHDVSTHPCTICSECGKSWDSATRWAISREVCEQFDFLDAKGQVRGHMHWSAKIGGSGLH